MRCAILLCVLTTCEALEMPLRPLLRGTRTRPLRIVKKHGLQDAHALHNALAAAAAFTILSHGVEPSLALELPSLQTMPAYAADGEQASESSS